jgi:hypothetical protein
MIFLLLLLVCVGFAITWWRSPKIGHVQDEAQLAGIKADYIKARQSWCDTFENPARFDPEGACAGATHLR